MLLEKMAHNLNNKFSVMPTELHTSYSKLMEMRAESKMVIFTPKIPTENILPAEKFKMKERKKAEEKAVL